MRGEGLKGEEIIGIDKIISVLDIQRKLVVTFRLTLLLLDSARKQV